MVQSIYLIPPRGACVCVCVCVLPRAFPSLLGLERERHMVGVVRYLKDLGVQNVGRFVSRLPPVLGYDVRTNLMPKVCIRIGRVTSSVVVPTPAWV